MKPEPTRLSELFRDPIVRAAFERVERDNGNQFAVPAKPKPVLIDGAAKSLEMV